MSEIPTPLSAGRGAAPSPADVRRAALSPLAAEDRKLSRWLALFVGLWLAAGASSALLQLALDPQVDPGDPPAFTDELKLVGEMAATHGAVLRLVLDRKLDSPESFGELDEELTKHKQKLRDLSLVSVQDSWSRDPLVALRRDLIEAYYQVQRDLERMREEPKDPAARQQLFKTAVDRLQERRRSIVTTTHQLLIRPVEVDIEDDTRQQIYGITEEMPVNAPR